MSDTILRGVHYPGGGTFTVVLGDLLQQNVEAIVNAANGHLAHGGGVAAAIARAAGARFDEESREYVRAHGVISTGSAAVTGAGRLGFRGVIHAVGPRQGEGDERAKLESALRTAFVLAGERGWRSLAFPAVSSGIFAVPLDVCARAYVGAVSRFFAEHPDGPLRDIRLCLFGGAMADAVAQELARQERGQGSTAR